MAKVGFWLRGARGKMGGAVLMKSENGTVARENVTPKNPRTSKQMYQRAIFATVASAAKAMKQLINHSFYGVAEGNKSIQEFRKLNLAKLRNKVASDLKQDLGTDELIAMLAPKNYKFIVPNEYQISSGTLASLNIFALGGRYVKINDVTFTSASYTAKEFIAKLLGINPGEQLTFAAITAYDSGLDTPLYVVPGHEATEEGMSCGEASFISRRLVFKEYESNETAWDDEITRAEIAEGAGSVAPIINAVIDTDKSDETLVSQILGTFTYDTSVANQVTVKSTVPYVQMGTNLAANAIIRSKFTNGAWNYNTAFMTIATPISEVNYGVTPEDAVKSYTDGVTVGESTDPFLDEGGSGGTLE